jgi:hypothetical protein
MFEVRQAIFWDISINIPNIDRYVLMPCASCTWKLKDTQRLHTRPFVTRRKIYRSHYIGRKQIHISSIRLRLRLRLRRSKFICRICEMNAKDFDDVNNLSYVLQGTIINNLSYAWYLIPIPVATRSNAWVCSRSLTGIAGSNPAVHMDMSLVSVACCQGEVSPTGRSLIQRSPTECVVSECDRGTWTMRRPRGCRAMRKSKIWYNYKVLFIPHCPILKRSSCVLLVLHPKTIINLAHVNSDMHECREDAKPCQ